MLITDIEHGKLSRECSGKFQAAPWPPARQSQTEPPAGKLLAIELEIHRARCRSDAVAAARRILNGFS